MASFRSFLISSTLCLLILCISYIESKSNYNIEKCTPECSSNGVCFHSKCYCKDGFIGDDCSVKIQSKGFRVNMVFLIGFFISAAIVGILFSYIIFKICKYCCTSEVKKPNFNTSGINLMETWEKKN